MNNCQLCGKEKEKLIKYHIDYKKNIIINLCKKCHVEIHKVISSIPRKSLDKPINLKCRCDYSWTYKGKNPFYATCPSCLRKVKIEEGEIQ